MTTTGAFRVTVNFKPELSFNYIMNFWGEIFNICIKHEHCGFLITGISFISVSFL